MIEAEIAFTRSLDCIMEVMNRQWAYSVIIDKKCYLRNRFVLAVICCLIYHCLEVSRLKWIKSRARSASDLSTYD